MSTGQIVGAIGGGVIGFFLGGPAGALQGASWGAALGGALDPPAGPTIQGPRLSDLSFQSSTYGAPLARVYGTVPIAGNIFWLENNALKEVVTKTKQGGKGGPSTTTKTYTYFATFAVSLCDTSKTGAIAGVRRIWIGSNLIYNAGSDDLETVIASNKNADGWKLYTGTATQDPDPRMQANIGVADCPAYRRTAYIVFYDLALEKYGNSLQAAQVKVEVVTSAADALNLMQTSTFSYVNPTGETPFGPRPYYVTPEKVVFWVPQWGASYPANSSWVVHEIYSSGAHQQYPSIALATTGVPPGGDSDQSSESWVKTSDIFPALGDTMASGSGYIQHRGNVYAGFNNYGGTRKVYSRTNHGVVHGPVSPSSTASCFAIDVNGNIWVIAENGVWVYDSSLSLLHTHAITIPHMTIPFARAAVIDGVVMLYTGDYSGSVQRIDVNALTCTLVTALPDVPVISAYGGSIYLDATMMVRACSRDTGLTGGPILVVEWFNLSKVSTGEIPLASIVSEEMQIANIDTGDIDVSLLTADVRGVRFAGGSIRSAVAPLQGAYPFDVIPSGYKIKCVPRGQSSAATIDIGELGAVGGNGMADIVLDGPSREMDTQLPRKMVTHYLDPDRDYDIGEQSQERTATDSVNIETQELPIVLLADEAAGVAQQLLYLRWLEREDYAFTLPATRNNLEPADSINITTDYGTIPLRLTEITYGSDDVLQCKAKPNAPAIYTPNAVGGKGVIPSGTIGLQGASVLVLMDIPLLPTMSDEPSYVAAMGGYTSGWQAGAAMRSLDGEASFDQMESFYGAGTFGRATSTLSADGGYVIDYTATLSVNLICGTLESFTVDQLLSGKGLYAYGADGRWEVLNAANAVLQGDGSYLLSTFLRGCYGTEWATGLHQAGDYLVYLEDIDNLQIALTTSVIGVPAYWRGVTMGQSVSAAASQQLTYAGVLLKPLSPVNAVAVLSDFGDYVITWSRRSRKQSNWFVSGLEPALGEQSESYVLEIYNGSTLVRSIATTTASASYSAAQQIADFGALQSVLSVKLYQISATVGYGYPLSVVLVPVPTGITVLLLHFDGANGSTTFTDVSGKAVAANGNAQISTAQFKFGGASGLFDGTGDYLSLSASTDFLPTVALTLECWVYAAVVSGGKYIFTNRPPSSTLTGWLFGIFSGKLAVTGYTAAGATVIDLSSTASISVSTWTHVAVTRDSNGVWRMFINGVLDGFGTETANVGASANPVYIGHDQRVAGQDWNGYIDELRIVNGAARYTASFTPPSAPF